MRTLIGLDFGQCPVCVHLSPVRHFQNYADVTLFMFGSDDVLIRTYLAIYFLGGSCHPETSRSLDQADPNERSSQFEFAQVFTYYQAEPVSFRGVDVVHLSTGWACRGALPVVRVTEFELLNLVHKLPFFYYDIGIHCFVSARIVTVRWQFVADVARQIFFLCIA